MSQIQQYDKTVYRCSDEAEFDDVLAAEAHQAGIDAADDIDAFLQEYATTSEYSQKTLVTARVILQHYEEFKATRFSTVAPKMDEEPELPLAV